MERLKRITAINVNPFLTKIDFHVAKNTKILTFPESDIRFPDFYQNRCLSWLRDPQILTAWTLLAVIHQPWSWRAPSQDPSTINTAEINPTSDGCPQNDKQSEFTTLGGQFTLYNSPDNAPLHLLYVHELGAIIINRHFLPILGSIHVVSVIKTATVGAQRLLNFQGKATFKSESWSYKFRRVKLPVWATLQRGGHLSADGEELRFQYVVQDKKLARV